MSSTPEASSLVLRDDRPVPAALAGDVPAGATVLVVLDEADADPAPVGAGVLTGTLPALKLAGFWVRPDRRSEAGAVLQLVRVHASTAGARVLGFEVAHEDALAAGLVAGTRVLGEHLSKPVAADVEAPAGLWWHPMGPDELGPWRKRQVRLYAEDNLERSGGDLELARQRAERDFARLLPDGVATADTALVLLGVGREQVGHLWLRHHHAPGVSFVYDVEVAEEQRGRGYGRAAMVLAEVLTRQAGDEVLGLHVFGGNVAARALYRSLGHTVRSTTHDLLARG